MVFVTLFRDLISVINRSPFADPPPTFDETMRPFGTFRVGWRIEGFQTGCEGHAQWRCDCDRLPAGTFDIRLVFRSHGGLLCLVQIKELSSCGARHAVPQNDRPYSGS